MAGETVITLVGNLVDDPELRFTPSGAAVAKFRIASTPRTFDRQTNEWKDGESLFLTCNVWRQPAENVAESLQRGMRVIVQGRLRQRTYDTKEGEKRTVFEVEVDEVGPQPALRHREGHQGPAVRRSGRSGGFGGGNGGGGFGADSRAATGGGWGAQNPGGGQSARPTTPGRPAPRRAADSTPVAVSGGGGWGAPSGGGFSEEPPF